MKKTIIQDFKKALVLIVVVIFTFMGASAQHTPSSTQNYIYTRTILKDNVKTQADINALTPADVRAEVQYFDGLGRATQNVQVKASPDGNDIVTPISYDAYGRQDKNYLPYSAAGTNGVYRPSAFTEQAAFYTAPPATSIPVIPNPFSQTLFEASPLNRSVELAAPGTAWAMGSNHTVKTGYEINIASEVKLWNVDNNGTINTGATSAGYYAAGQLYKNVIWDEHRNRVIEYKDKSGQVVCKKVQDGGDTTVPTYITTQYIYDDFGRLAYVVPPALENISSFTETDQNFVNYIYAYHYDERARLVEKRVPGKGWEYTVYNPADRPIFTSDAEQRNRGVWRFTKYDALGRIILMGEASIAATTTRAVLQETVNNTLKPVGTMELYELVAVDSIAQSNGGYTNRTLPRSDITHLERYYYDNYDFMKLEYARWGYHQPNGSENQSLLTKGLLTAKHNRTLDWTFSSSMFFYDSKGRNSKTVRRHHLDGVDIFTYAYNFAGELLSTTRNHYLDFHLDVRVDPPTVSITSSYEYDHAGRKVKTTEVINGQAPVVTDFTYNALGQLATRSAGGQNVSYAYNARGWLTQQSSWLFSLQLKYDEATQGAQFNGNIAQQLWTVNGQQHSFNYGYDRANRLISGINEENYGETGIGYDKMGNITTLTRQGPIGMPGLGTLSYSYNGNQLQSVSGGYSRSYTYNNIGSIAGDGVLNITYNQLNLPKQVSGTPIGTINYTYDAEGRKLTKQSVSETRHYLDGIETIGNSTVDLLHTESGVARNSGGVYSYEFFLKDHLGNTRVVHNSAGTVLQQTDYYPFGLPIETYTAVPNNYLYQGKELQREMGLGQFDFGARFYDPAIGRWHVLDPLADDPEQINKSPYAFSWNNPVNLIDPSGMKPLTDFIDIRTGTITHIEDGKDQVVAATSQLVSTMQNLFANDKDQYNSTLGALEKSSLNLNLTRKEFDFLAETLYAESTGGLKESIGIVNVLENRAANEGNNLMDQLKAEPPYGVYGVWKTSNGKNSNYKYSYTNETGTAADAKRSNIHKAIAIGLGSKVDVSKGAHFWDGSDIKTNKHYTAWGVTFTNSAHNLWNQKNTVGSRQLITTSAQGGTIFTKFQNQGKKWYISK